jgi:serine protease inhibitor
MQLVDFGLAEEAREQINTWGMEQTEDRIEELLSPGALSGGTALVLTNAAYFQAAWREPFAEEATHDARFTLLEGYQFMVPTMEQVANLGYAELPGVQAVELPYAGGELSMVILLPDDGSFEPFAQALDAGQLDTIVGALAPTSLRLALPKFRYDVGFELRDALTDLGMVDAFGDPADFSGMDGTRELCQGGLPPGLCRRRRSRHRSSGRFYRHHGPQGRTAGRTGGSCRPPLSLFHPRHRYERHPLLRPRRQSTRPGPRLTSVLKSAH